MLDFPIQVVYVPLAVLVATALIAVVVLVWLEAVERRRAAELAALQRRMFKPVLVHDRARGKLLRSARQGMNRAAAAKIRLVYNGG